MADDLIITKLDAILERLGGELPGKIDLEQIGSAALLAGRYFDIRRVRSSWHCRFEPIDWGGRACAYAEAPTAAKAIAAAWKQVPKDE